MMGWLRKMGGRGQGQVTAIGNSVGERLLKSSRRVFGFGVVLLLIAIAGEQFHEFLAPGSTVLEVGGEIIGRMVSWGYFFLFLGELGMALIIAATVALAIEAKARRDREESFQQAIQKLGESVVEGVYRIRHNEEYVRTVISSCLAVDYIRQDVVIGYEVSEFNEEECEKLDIRMNDWVKIALEFKYVAVNITHSAAELPGVYTVPLKVGKLRESAGMKSLVVGSKTYKPEEIKRLEIQPDDPEFNAADRSYRFPIPTIPQEGIPVQIKSEFVKQRSDTEIFAFLLPTRGATIRFTFFIDGLIEIGAKARTATEMRGPPQPYGKQIEWNIPGSLLPNNYVAVWWVTDPAFLEARATGERWHGPPAAARPPLAVSNSPIPSIPEAFAQGEDDAINDDETPVTEGLRSWINSAKGAISRRILRRNS